MLRSNQNTYPDMTEQNKEWFLINQGKRAFIRLSSTKPEDIYDTLHTFLVKNNVWDDNDKICKIEKMNGWHPGRGYFDLTFVIHFYNNDVKQWYHEENKRKFDEKIRNLKMYKENLDNMQERLNEEARMINLKSDQLRKQAETLDMAQKEFDKKKAHYLEDSDFSGGIELKRSVSNKDIKDIKDVKDVKGVKGVKDKKYDNEESDSSFTENYSSSDLSDDDLSEVIEVKSKDIKKIDDILAKKKNNDLDMKSNKKKILSDSDTDLSDISSDESEVIITKKTNKIDNSKTKVVKKSVSKKESESDSASELESDDPKPKSKTKSIKKNIVKKVSDSSSESSSESSSDSDSEDEKPVKKSVKKPVNKTSVSKTPVKKQPVKKNQSGNSKKNGKKN